MCVWVVLDAFALCAVRRLGKRFETTLLLQSFAVIACHLLLVDASMRARVAEQKDAAKEPRVFENFRLSEFWQWDDTFSYVQALGVFSAALSVVSFLYLHEDWCVEALGALALGLESVLALPQVWRNYRTKGTTGLR